MTESEKDVNVTTVARGKISPHAPRPSEPGTRRLRSIRPYAAMMFILMGLSVWGVEIVLNWTRARPINGPVIFLGSVAGFVGFYMIDHKDAKDAGGFVFERLITLVKTVRGGRATDPPGTVVTETTVVKDEEVK